MDLMTAPFTSGPHSWNAMGLLAETEKFPKYRDPLEMNLRPELRDVYMEFENPYVSVEADQKKMEAKYYQMPEWDYSGLEESQGHASQPCRCNNGIVDDENDFKNHLRSQELIEPCTPLLNNPYNSATWVNNILDNLETCKYNSTSVFTELLYSLKELDHCKLETMRLEKQCKIFQKMYEHSKLKESGDGENAVNKELKRDNQNALQTQQRIFNPTKDQDYTSRKISEMERP